MRTHVYGSVIAGAAVTLTLLIGCADGDAVAPAEGTGPGLMAAPAAQIDAASTLRRAAQTDHVQIKAYFFVADYPDAVVNIYALRSGREVGQLTGFGSTDGLATDRAGNLYVVDGHNAEVQVYAPPYNNTPTTTIGVPGGIPESVAISLNGTIAVVSSNAANNLPNVTFFAANTTTPCATIVPPSPYYYLADAAFDRRGTLFVNGLFDPRYTAHVGEITGECDAKQFAELTTTNMLHSVGAIQVDTNDNIAITDRAVRQIDVYAHPVGNSLGAPTSTVALPGSGSPATFAFASSGTDVYVADSDDGLVFEYAYPAGGAILEKYRVAGDEGSIAVTRAEVP